MSQFPESKALKEFEERAKKLNIPPSPVEYQKSINAMFSAYGGGGGLANYSPMSQTGGAGGYSSLQDYCNQQNALMSPYNRLP